MGGTFNVDEIFAMAEAMERQGARFYRAAAVSCKDQSRRRLLIALAEMEEEHEKVFIAIRKDFMDQRPDLEGFDPEGLTASYLHAIADGKVFDSEKQLTGEETMADIIKHAIKLEKDSIVFYIGIKEMVPISFGQDKVEKIIQEEMYHVVSLNRVLASLTQPS